MRRAKLSLLAGALLATIGGCSSDPQRAEGSFDYVDARQAAPLSAPQGLKLPEAGEQFRIPAAQGNGRLGSDVWVQTPVQVLPLAEGSSVIEGVNRYAVRFEIVEGSGDLRDQTWYSLWEFFAQQGLKGRFWDRDGGVIITDWQTVDLTEEESFWSILNPFHETPPHTTLRQRFLLTLDVAPHGRSATLGAALLGLEMTVNGSPRSQPIRPEEERQYVVGMLNAAVGYYQSKQRVLVEEAREQERHIAIALEQDSAGVPIFIVEQGFNRVWSALPQALTEMGFEIKDRDKTRGWFQVKHAGTAGFWSSLFGGEDRLPLERHTYQVMVGDRGNARTSITILDDENRPLRDDVAAKTLEVFRQVLGGRP